MRRAACVLAALAAASTAGAAPRAITVCSKKFTESVIAGEILTQQLRSRGFTVEHRRQLGGTQILWRALAGGSCDAYVEYAGTLREEIFAGRLGPDPALERALAERGVVFGPPLGFDDRYALAMLEERARALAVRTISDLRAHPSLRLAFSDEFVNRRDGWPGLRDAYGLEARSVRTIDHDLAYRALASGAIDLTDAYATDPEIPYFRLRLLVDDRGYFPDYRAVILARADLPPRAAEALAELRGRIDARTMARLNARVQLERAAESRAAAEFLAAAGMRATATTPPHEPRLAAFAARTREHLTLVALSLACAIALAVPLGVAAARAPRLGRAILAAAGVVQTIPSLALLVLLIPLVGIGTAPALIALFIYSLLPIVRGTHSGLTTLAPELRESARALGLGRFARLRLVELPLAAPAILSGIKTAAVINVGTATLGAIIGAGGYGEPILSGIRLDRLSLILQGAIPAAVLALLIQWLFDGLERLLVSPGLRLRAAA